VPVAHGRGGAFVLIGDDQDAFLRFWRDELRKALRDVTTAPVAP
jgi:hypothetical protein